MKEKLEVLEHGELVENENEIVFSTPYLFEGIEYTSVDLSGMLNLTAMDMLAIDREFTRAGSTSILPEVSMEYVIKLAAKATKKPVEFFEQLPVNEIMKLKMKVISFLFWRG